MMTCDMLSPLLIPPMLVPWPCTTIIEQPSRFHMLYLHAGLVPPIHYLHDTSMQGSVLVCTACTVLVHC